MFSRFRSPRDASPLKAGLWLALVLAGAKVTLFLTTRADAVAHGAKPTDVLLLSLAMVSFKDVLFAIAVGFGGYLLLEAVSSQPVAARRMRRLHVAFCVLCALYGIIALGVFDYFGVPLSYDLLRFVHGAAALRSSLEERLTIPIASALIGVPLALWAVIAWDGCRRTFPKWGLVAAGVWIGLGCWQLFSLSDEWKSDRQHAFRMSISPHTELIRSTVAGVIGTKPSFPKDFSAEDTFEFRSIGARGGSSAGFSPPPGINRPRNVIVVTLESVGTKYMSLYGSRYDTTPSLVAEAQHALVFNNIHAHASQTYCSFRSINFSIYPGLPWCYAPWGGRPMAPPLATVMRQRGARTIYLHNGTLEWGGDRWMLDERYDTVEDYLNLGCKPLTSWGAEDRCTIDRLIRWIDEKPGQPFLAYCWTDQTHDPYSLGPGVICIDFFGSDPPPRHAADLSRYLTILRQTDQELGRLFQALRDRNIADDTLVVITGDHGEAFADPHEQRGHGSTVYQEEINVPLIIWNPRLFPQGERLSTVGGHVDLNPTVADLLGFAPPGEWQGYSLFDPARPSRAYFMTNISAEYLFGLREDQWKYVLDATSGREILFDVARDPNEQQNLARTEPEHCRRLRHRVAAWVSFEEDFLHSRAD